MTPIQERERLERAVAEDRRELRAALDEIESVALQSLDLRVRIAEAPAKWLLVAAGLGLMVGLRGSARRRA